MTISAGPLTMLDMILAAIFLIALPVYCAASYPAFIARISRGDPSARAREYIESIALLLAALLAIAIAWSLERRPLAELGLTLGDDWRALAGWLFAIVGSAYALFQFMHVERDAKVRAQLRSYLAATPGIDAIRPRTRPERRLFHLVSVTAGVGEEVVFRGFLIWALAAWLPLWLAAILALAAFTTCHAYQVHQGRPAALLRPAAAGGVFTVLYLASGTLLPAMLLHTALDIGGELAMWRAREDDQAVKPRDA